MANSYFCGIVGISLNDIKMPKIAKLPIIASKIKPWILLYLTVWIGLFLGFSSAVSAQGGCLPSSGQCAGGGSANSGNAGSVDVSGNPIMQDITLVVNFLSAGVGIFIVGMIILGGIQYAMAGDNAQAVTAAKQRITNALIALIAFLFLFGFVQWLVPGGVL